MRLSRPQCTSRHRAPRSAPIHNTVQGRRLDGEAGGALGHRLAIAEEVDDAVDDPHRASGGGRDVADIDCEQPKRRQEDRRSFLRVRLDAVDALEIRIARDRRQLDAVNGAGAGDPE